MRVFTSLYSFIIAVAILVLPLGTGHMRAFAQSSCKGLSKSACEARGGCSYVGAHTRSNGARVKAFCRAKAGGGSSTSKKSTSKKSTKKNANSTSSHLAVLLQRKLLLRRNHRARKKQRERRSQQAKGHFFKNQKTAQKLNRQFITGGFFVSITQFKRVFT